MLKPYLTKWLSLSHKTW